MHYERFRQSKNSISLTAQRGFTLIETIVGIVVLSISLSIFTTLIYPVAIESAKQVHQIRAAELGQSMLNEILGKAFDENSDMSSGLIRCGEEGVTCTAAVNLGPDEISPGVSEGRNVFDDVDDYNNLSDIESSLGQNDSLTDIYRGFKVNVQVRNDSDSDGDSDDNDNNYTAKLITVTVTTPQDFDFVFSAYRYNF
jgi:MSHA pilin protein MshD